MKLARGFEPGWLLLVGAFFSPTAATKLDVAQLAPQFSRGA
jgi:hypothetical protein